MALTFPRAMPTAPLDDMGFELLRVDAEAPELSGAGGGVSLGEPLWRMQAAIANTDRDETDEIVAFIDSLRGAQRLFYGYDVTRPLPKMYPGGFAGLDRAGGGAFDGTATSWAVNTDRDLLQLNNLPAGLDLRLRDYVGFTWATGGAQRRSLHRYIEAGVANGSGGHARNIEPPVPTLVPSGAVATLLNPTCLMRQVTRETSLGARDVLHSTSGRFTAIQVLLP